MFILSKVCSGISGDYLKYLRYRRERKAASRSDSEVDGGRLRTALSELVIFYNKSKDYSKCLYGAVVTRRTCKPFGALEMRRSLVQFWMEANLFCFLSTLRFETYVLGNRHDYWDIAFY